MEVVGLSHEFQEIVSDNAPEGLPHVRRISHQIHFDTGSKFS